MNVAAWKNENKIGAQSSDRGWNVISPPGLCCSRLAVWTGERRIGMIFPSRSLISEFFLRDSESAKRNHPGREVTPTVLPNPAKFSWTRMATSQPFAII
jgi:hypothetical protein